MLKYSRKRKRNEGCAASVWEAGPCAEVSRIGRNRRWAGDRVDDRWIPMDATMGLGGIGAAHLKLANGNFKDADPLSSILAVIKVMGKIRIEVLEIE